jgi:protein-disulfide isomerase
VAPPAVDPASEMAMLGSADAPVTILEFSDYQCPYCRQHALETLPQLLETYIETGQVRYIFRDFPLPSHANARPAAEAARCAGDQAAYWQMHERLFAEQEQWAELGPDDLRATFVAYAGELGLDTEAFQQCLESGVYTELVQQDQVEGYEAGVEGAPSFFINDRFAAGAYPFENFQGMIEAALAGADD